MAHPASDYWLIGKFPGFVPRRIDFVRHLWQRECNAAVVHEHQVGTPATTERQQNVARLKAPRLVMRCHVKTILQVQGEFRSHKPEGSGASTVLWRHWQCEKHALKTRGAPTCSSALQAFSSCCHASVCASVSRTRV